MEKCNRDLFLNSNKNNKKVIHFSIFLFLNVTIPTCCSRPYSAHTGTLPCLNMRLPLVLCFRSLGCPCKRNEILNQPKLHWEFSPDAPTALMLMHKSPQVCLERSSSAALADQMSDGDIASRPSGPWSAAPIWRGFYFVCFCFLKRRCLGANRIKNWFWCVMYGRSCNFHKLNLNHSPQCFPHNVDAMGLETSTDLH